MFFMQTKHPCVLIHTKIKGEIGTIKHIDFYTDPSKAVLLL